jgi:hypothetical protein
MSDTIKILSSISTERYKNLSLVYKSEGGTVVGVDGPPVWEVGSPSGTATLRVAEDGLSAKIVPGDVSELIEVKTRADARFGEEVVEVTLDFIQPVTLPEADPNQSGGIDGDTGLKSELEPLG